MRPSILAFLTTSLLASAAFAAAPATPAVPASVLTPPAYVHHDMSVDAKLNADGTSLGTDAKTLQGIEGQASAPASVDRLNDARTQYIRLNNQLGADVRNHASKDTIMQDRAAITAAKKQIDLDSKACVADVKASGGEAAACGK